MWRVPGERVTLDLDGPSVEVEQMPSWMLQLEALELAGRFYAATTPEAEYAALATLFDHFVREARPAWDIHDANGPMPVSGRGMARLPLPLALEMVNQWLASLPVPQTSAVDEVLPPGQLNREVKRRLRSVKKAA